MGEPAPIEGVAAYRADRVRRALKEFRSILGTRAALVAGEAGGGAEPGRFLVRVVPPSSAICSRAVVGARAVVGVAGAVPVLSGSLTGVLLAHALPARGTTDSDEFARRTGLVLAEASRLLQPGGVVLLLERIALRETDGDVAQSVRSFADVSRVLRAAGLELGRRVACHGTPSRIAAGAARLPRWLWRFAAAVERLAQRLRLARPDEITGLLVARKPGGFGVEFPELRRMLGGMLLPPRWLERKRG